MKRIWCDCEARDIFLWKGRACESDKEAWLNFSLIWMSYGNSIHSMWKFASNIFMSTENGVAYTHTHTQDFFLKSWKLFSNLFIEKENTAAYFSLFTVKKTQTVSRQCIKMHKIIHHNLSLPQFKFHFKYCYCLKYSTDKVAFTLKMRV